MSCPTGGPKGDPRGAAGPSGGTVLPGLGDPVRGGAPRPAAPPEASASAKAAGAPAWAKPAPAAPAWSQPAPAPAAPAWSQPAPAAYPPPSPYAAPASQYGQPAGYGAQSQPYGGQYSPPGQNAGANQPPPNFAQPGGYAHSQAPYMNAPAQHTGYAQPSSWGGTPSQQPWSPQRNPMGVGEDTDTMDAPRAGANPAPAAPQVGGQTMHQPSPYQEPAQPAARPGSCPVYTSDAADE